MNIKTIAFSIKIFALVFVLGVSFSGSFASRVAAQAADPLSPAILTQVTLTAVATGATAAEETLAVSWETVGKGLLDYIAYAAAQNLLTQLTNSTLKWIQGGFHGSPSFEVDLDQTATEIADNIAGGLVLKLRGIATCNFSTTYRDDLINSIYLAPKKRDYIFDNEARCPFQETFNFTASGFYGEANRLTWDAFGAALEDSGNPYGMKTITAKEMAKREATAKAKNEKKLSWSNGYADIVDTKNCNYPAGTFHTADSLKAGDSASRQIASKVRDPATGKFVDNPDAALSGQEERENRAFQMNREMQEGSAFKAKQKEHCKITTPGNILSDQLTKTLGVDMDRIGFADNMNKIISAFLDQVMQKTVRGVFGAGNRSYSTGSLGDPLGGRRVGGPAACYVRVTTGDSTPAQTEATIRGSVVCAGDDSQANVSVWFKWGTTSPLGDTASIKEILLSHNVSGNNPESFTTRLEGLAPGTKYFYSAHAETSQILNAQHTLDGVVKSFITSPLPLP